MKKLDNLIESFFENIDAIPCSAYDIEKDFEVENVRKNSCLVEIKNNSPKKTSSLQAEIFFDNKKKISKEFLNKMKRVGGKFLGDKKRGKLPGWEAIDKLGTAGKPAEIVIKKPKAPKGFFLIRIKINLDNFKSMNFLKNILYMLSLTLIPFIYNEF